jgi:hypothetical protein
MAGSDLLNRRSAALSTTDQHDRPGIRGFGVRSGYRLRWSRTRTFNRLVVDIGNPSRGPDARAGVHVVGANHTEDGSEPDGARLRLSVLGQGAQLVRSLRNLGREVRG